MTRPIAAIPTDPIAARTATSAETVKKTRDLHEATQTFEALLLRRVLASLEKTTRMSSSPGGAGDSQYGSMIVEALSDAIARSGGLGLSKAIESSLPSDQIGIKNAK